MVILSGEIAAYGENTKVADPGGQWLHDLTDLGGSPDLLRGCVKWADRISSAELLGPTIERAGAHRHGAAGWTSADRHSVRMHDGTSQ
jgi:hypothetical protein